MGRTTRWWSCSRPQNYREHELVMACAMLGRLLYKPTVDGRDILLYLRGVGGSGKSSLLRLIQSFFDPELVAILANKTEEMFGLENYINRRIILATDLTKDANFDTGDILNIVSGDTLSIRRKNKNQVYTSIECHFVGAGNEFPMKWADVEGNFLRRMFNIDFPEPAPGLKRHLPLPSAEIWRSCLPLPQCGVPQDVRRFPPTVDFWSQVPVRFIKNRMKFLANTSCMLAYILEKKNSGYIEIRKDLYMQEESFTNDFKAWCIKYGYKPTDDLQKMSTLLKHMQCEVRSENRWRPQTHRYLAEGAELPEGVLGLGLEGGMGGGGLGALGGGGASGGDMWSLGDRGDQVVNHEHALFPGQRMVFDKYIVGMDFKFRKG